MGSTFSVTLPISILHVDEAHDREHPTVETGDSEMLALPRLDGARVVVVEDEADARDVLERVLRDQGATVESYASAAEALAAIKLARPSVVVSDVGMPGMDGYQMIRALRASEPAGERLPALALTAFARSEDRKRALVAGFQAHLAKPFDMAELVLLVANLVGR